MSDLDFRRNVDRGFRRKADKSVLELKDLKAEYNVCKSEVSKCKNRSENEKNLLFQARSRYEQANSRLSDIQMEIDSDPLPEGAQPRPRIHLRDQVNLEVIQLFAAMEAQETSTQDASQAVMEAERRLFEADRNINRFAETLEDTALAIATIAELDKEKADRLAKIESDVIKRKEKEKALIKEAKDAQEREMNELKRQQAETAKKLNVVARSKMATATSKTRELTSQMKNVHETQLADRTEAVLELKTNVAAVNAKLATQAERYRKKIADSKQRLEDEKEALLAKGLNPYVEFRKKELDQEAEIREKKMRDSVEKNKLELAIRIEKEQRFEDKQLKAERLAHEYEKKHRESQGRHVVEEKNRAYIVSRTSDGREVLDPTGRVARVDPSQITDIADYSFGLGKSARIPADSMRRITGQIRETLRADEDDLGEYGRLTAGLVQKTQMSIEENDSEEVIATPAASGSNRSELAQLSSLAPQNGSVPGIDKAALTVNLRGGEIEKQTLMRIAVEEDGTVSGTGQAQFNAVRSPKYKPVELSKFERDALERAKDRHRDRIENGVEQIAGGKVFHGQSFVSKPADLVFKDFEVGRKYKKVFTLTNVSYTFNSFKILDLTDDVTDFFIVTFEKPGRMSAGMSCSIEIEFTPQINQDIFTSLSFLTETGPVDIPLHCLIKRCAPRITTPLIDFGTVVMGQILHQQLKIVNTQALTTSFSIYPIVEDGIELSDVVEDTEIVTSGSRRQSTSSGLKELVIPSNDVDQMDNGDVDNLTGSTPAINEAELAARVQRVLTDVVRRKRRENPNPLQCVTSEGVVDGYGNASIQIVCAPLTVGVIEQKFCVVFDGVRDDSGTVDADGVPVTREQTVVVTTTGEEVPIYVADEVMDLKCTLFDRIYRRKIVLKNRGRSAYRVIVKVAREFSAYVEVVPTMFFVQAKSSQSMNVKFTPLVDMLTKIAHFSLPYGDFENAALMSLPIEIQVVNQELPLYFVLKSSVTPSTVRLSVSSMDFGLLYVGQKSTQRITVQNVSMLPQKMAFVRLRKEFLVSPNDGFAVLLPYETMEFEVSFCPQSAIRYELDLSILTSFNDSYTIKVVAEGVDPPLLFTNAVIHMRTTGPGERVVESTMVTNCTRHTQSFEVVLPDKRFTWLSISPTVANLSPGQSCRLEIEYCPPSDVTQLDPVDWHKDLLATGNPVVPSPFDEWSGDSGWMFARGLYGELQWTKQGAGYETQDAAVVTSTEQADKDLEQTGELNHSSSGDIMSKDLPPEEWGVVGRWNLPIILKPRKKHNQEDISHSPNKTMTTTVKPSPLPLFLSVHTAVIPPQLEADTKMLDFGQISIGTRQLKTFRVFNKGYEAIKLKTIGLNAVGPLTLLRPIREILPGESRVVIVECLPMQPGLVVEVLEILAEDESVGGHRLRITMRVQGLKPSIDLEGLASPPSNWNPRSGILDFGNVLANDCVVKKFIVRNKSTFAVDARIVRVSGLNLPPIQQMELIERTASGLPIISIRPERVRIAQGATEEIEVTFRPDRGRFLPFREDLDVMIGETDEVLRVGVLGRSFARQVFVLPDNPRDETFWGTTSRDATAVENLLAVSNVPATRIAAVDAQNSLKLKFPETPQIVLEFSDPFASTADPTSYTVISAAPVTGKAPPVKGAPVISAPAGARQQTKRLLISTAKVNDNRPGLTPATFEIVLSPEARSSNIWTLSIDKGSLALGAADVTVDVMCTQAQPRSLGGIFVGSWKTFSAEVIIKGGWYAQGESDENRVSVTLKAFVCL